MDNSKLKEEEQGIVKDRSGNWVGGAVLVAVGLFFLLGNLTNLRFDNWWALFILIPVFAM